MDKVALLEIDGNHEECLYSQLLFLKEGGYDTALIYEAAVSNKFREINAGNKAVPFAIKGKKGLSYIKVLWEIRNYIVHNNYNIIIFNTPHGNLIRNLLLLPFPRSFRFYGTLHGLNKLRGSTTQKIISRKIKHYFLLNDYLKENLKRVAPSPELRFEAYYPIYFPDYPDAPVIDKPAGEYWIGVPGQVEYKRRDYETLVKAFAALPEKPNYKFLLLGNDKHAGSNGRELKTLTKQLGVADHFVFSGYLDYPEYHAFLKQCDIIAPLIHPGNDGFKKYLVYQISGAYNLAFAYRKPLMMLEDFETYEDFKENAVFYSLENLSEVLQKLPEETTAISEQMYRQPKWTFGQQCDRYLGFIRQ